MVQDKQAGQRRRQWHRLSKELRSKKLKARRSTMWSGVQYLADLQRYLQILVWNLMAAYELTV